MLYMAKHDYFKIKLGQIFQNNYKLGKNMVLMLNMVKHGYFN